MKKSIVMIGASGVVGGEVVAYLLKESNCEKLSLFNRRFLKDFSIDKVEQHVIDVSTENAYGNLLINHEVAICTLGVGQPSKVSKEEFLKIDKLAVLQFAKACKDSGIEHFELLASVGIHPNSRSFYLKPEFDYSNL